MSLDFDRFRRELESERDRLRAALESLEQWPGESEQEVAKPVPAKVEEITDSGIRKVAG